jgi:HSP20 family molecular chaperone IbpA
MFGMTPWRKTNGGTALMKEPFEKLFERFFGGPTAFGELMGWAPEYLWNLEVKETEKEYLVRAEVPGFEPEEIEVKLLGERLFIKAEHKTETKKEGEAEEKFFHRYEREVTLPAGVEPEKVEALYRNGVLEVHLPRKTEALGKTIPVKT